MSTPVWSYWEGEMWPHIKVCIESLQRTCENFQLLTPGNIWNYISPDVFHENFRNIKEPAHRADCFRAAILSEIGGFWFDCDTIGITDPSHLVDDSVDCLYCVWSNPPRRVLNGNIYMRGGSAVAAQWLRGVNRAVSIVNKQSTPRWSMFGEKTLTPVVFENSKTSREIKRDHFLPIDIDNNVMEFFLRRSRWQEFISERTVCFGLNNSWMMHNKKRDMLLPDYMQSKSQVLIHQLLSDTRVANSEHLNSFATMNSDAC